MSDMKGGEFDGRESLLPLFNALTILPLQVDGLLVDFNEIPTVNIYEANGIKGDDWEQCLNDQGQAWIITPLHYVNGGSTIRIESEKFRWNNKYRNQKNHGETSWREGKYTLDQRRLTQQDKKKKAGGQKYTMFENKPDEYKAKTETSLQERKYNLVKAQSADKQQASNEGEELEVYTMFEYTPDEEKPTHALCRIIKKLLEGKEIDHTDSNNGDKGETSQSQESMQQGRNYQNTTADYNQQNLEIKLRKLIKHHSYADIRKKLDQIDSEKLPAASPKEHSTEAPVSNTRKRGRCTLSMEAVTSTQGQEQVKVEMLKSKSCRGHATNLQDGTDRNSMEFGEQSSHHGNYNEKNAKQGSNPINLADIPQPYTFEELYNSDDHEMVEQNAVEREPENTDSNNIFEGLTDLNPEDLHANRSFTRSHENGTIWDNLLWDENKPNCWDW